MSCSLWKTATSPDVAIFFQSIVAEQLSTCPCCFRQICHGDGCHPGRLAGASHPCSEDGRPLRARCTSQTDVEAGGGGSAAGDGLNAELQVEMLLCWYQDDLLLSHVPSWVCGIEITAAKRKTTSHEWTGGCPWCRAVCPEVGCESDRDFTVIRCYLWIFYQEIVNV